MAGLSIPFGQHRDKPLADVPVLYLDWLIGRPWMTAPRWLALHDAIVAHLETPGPARELAEALEAGLDEFDSED